MLATARTPMQLFRYEDVSHRGAMLRLLVDHQQVPSNMLPANAGHDLLTRDHETRSTHVEQVSRMRVLQM